MGLHGAIAVHSQHLPAHLLSFFPLFCSSIAVAEELQASASQPLPAHSLHGSADGSCPSLSMTLQVATSRPCFLASPVALLSAITASCSTVSLHSSSIPRYQPTFGILNSKGLRSLSRWQEGRI